MPPTNTRISELCHRSGVPSAPWPWLCDIDDVPGIPSSGSLETDPCCSRTDEQCWKDYPESQFPNWTTTQVENSGLSDGAGTSPAPGANFGILRCDFSHAGLVHDPGRLDLGGGSYEEVWARLLADFEGRQENVHVRILFLEGLSRPLLHMLGARLNVEPTFFSSSINWIPSRFQAQIRRRKGDHISITLKFVKVIACPTPKDEADARKRRATFGGLDVRAPLRLSDEDGYLQVDLLSVYLIRSIDGSTLLSYHHSDTPRGTSSVWLRKRIYLASQSLHWRQVFRESADPTLVLLLHLWHALSGWDQAVDVLWRHMVNLEAPLHAFNLGPSKIALNEAKAIRPYYDHCLSALDGFTEDIQFILESENPFAPPEDGFVRRECNGLLQEVDRLKSKLRLEEKMLDHAFHRIAVHESLIDTMRGQKALEDSRAMKRIADLSVLFLPAGFIAAIFGMNVKEITSETGSLAHYFPVAAIVTWATMRLAIAREATDPFVTEDETTFWEAFFHWPFVLIYRRLWGGKPSDGHREYEMNGQP